MLDDCTMHDASAICEMLARTLEQVHSIAQNTGRQMPTTVLLCSDNTVREAKNQIVMLMLANLAGQFKCRVTGLLNLRKSHTHDKLDQTLTSDIFRYFFNLAWYYYLSLSCAHYLVWLPSRFSFALRLWGILTRRVAATDDMQDPNDVMNVMVREIQRPALRGWVGLGTEVSAVKLDSARSWKWHFSGPQQAKLSGGLLEDSTANHCFIFMLRRGGASFCLGVTISCPVVA